MLKKIKKLAGGNVEYLLLGMLVFLSFMHFVFALRTDNFFSVDDFAVLAYIKDKNLFELVREFLLHGDIFGFGKVVGYIIFKLLFDAFGVNALYFNLSSFVLHTANVVLLYFVCKRLSGNVYTSAFAAILFNKFYLFYFSNIHEVMAVLFFLSTLYVWFYRKKVFKSSLLFILALLSKEVAFVTPFVLTSLSFIGKKFRLKNFYPYFLILGIYVLYEIPFYLKKASLPTPDSYKILVTPQAFAEGLTFYFSPLILTFLVLLPVYTKKWKSYWILSCAILALMPVMFLVHRREPYYFYLPASIVSIFLAVNLPKISLKNSFLYLIALLVFGGRSVFPKIAWQRFPNWQKVSIMNVVQKVEDGVDNGEKEIYIGDINLERDAKLVIQNDLIGLFSKDKKLSKYSFSYKSSESSIAVEDK